MPTEVKSRSKHVSSDYHTPRTVEDVTERNVQAILQLEEAAKANRSNADRIADLIAAFCGSMMGACDLVRRMGVCEHFTGY